MIEATTVLLLAIVWPLALAGAIAFRATRGAALNLAPWAALPGLAASAVPGDTELYLPGFLLDSGLLFDSVGRVFLILSASLWLATGLLARPLMLGRDGNRFAVLLLLATAGAIAMPLAADVVLFFAASTIASYALYGLLVHDGDAQSLRSGRVLIVLFVLSDLVIFELLLGLTQSSGNVGFASMREGFADADSRELMFTLLIVGFGVKMGLVGFHYWLAPVVTSSQRALRPALIGLMFGAGLLGWLRLVPGGELNWSTAGTVLQWLAWISLTYATVVGFLQAHYRSVLAYAAMALSGLWLAVLGFGLLHPQAWDAIIKTVQAAIWPTGFALAALLLLDRETDASIPALPRQLFTGLRWLAGLTLGVAAASLADLPGRFDTAATLPASWASAAFTFLAVRSILLLEPAGDGGPLHTVGSRQQTIRSAVVLMCAGVLTAVAAVVALSDLLVSLPTAGWRLLMPVAAAALASWLSTAWLTSRLPVVPPGDLVVPIGRFLTASLDRGKHFAMVNLPFWRDAWFGFFRDAWSKLEFWRVLHQLELALGHWRTVLQILLLLGLIAAWMVATG